MISNDRKDYQHSIHYLSQIRFLYQNLDPKQFGLLLLSLFQDSLFFYLFYGVFFVYIFQTQINLRKINSFLYVFLFLFFLSPILYSYESIIKTDKRTDYPGKEIAAKVQLVWDQDFDKEIQFVTGNEWKAGNLSYHLKSRPKWEGYTNNETLNKSSIFICVEEICLGRY